MENWQSWQKVASVGYQWISDDYIDYVGLSCGSALWFDALGLDENCSIICNRKRFGSEHLAQCGEVR